VYGVERGFLRRTGPGTALMAVAVIALIWSSLS